MVNGGKAGINFKQTGNSVQFLGELTNQTATIRCFVFIQFHFLDQNNTRIGTLPTAGVNGSTYTLLSGLEEHTCLDPQETGSFETPGAAIPLGFADFDFILRDDNPPLRQPDVQLEIAGASEAPDGQGHAVFTGLIQNNTPSGSLHTLAYDIKVMFTYLDGPIGQGKVIGTESFPMGHPCVIDNQGRNFCLGQGESTPINVSTNTCAGCYYYEINHSE